MATPSVRVLVLTAFGPEPSLDDRGELGRWLDGYGEFAHEIPVPGTRTPVWVTDHGVAVTATGIGPTQAAATTTAILGTDALDTEDAYVLIAGIAGIAPHVGTVGSVVVADHVVNWDAKMRSGAGTAVEPWGFGPKQAYDLDSALVETAATIADGVELADSDTARAYRQEYEQDAARGPPGVTVGTTVAGADFWHGQQLAEQVESLVDRYDAGSYATTECEGFGVAVVCDRFDRIDRLVSVRAASNFDRPPVVGDAEHWQLMDEAYTNAYRVGREIADEIAENWETWREGPPVAKPVSQ